MNTISLTSILQRSNELITSESFRMKHRIGNAFIRSRKLSFQNLIYFILRSVHKSISINYSELPLASASVLYDVLNDILVDVSLHPYRYNERESAKEHIKFLPDFPNSIIVFDRGYPSEDMFRFLNSKRILFLMRIPKTFKKAITEEKDSLFTYPASRDKDSLTLRRIYFQLDDGTKEYLVTNLMSNQIDIEKFFDLYGLRWSVKSKYRELKNRLEIEAFNSIL